MVTEMPGRIRNTKLSKTINDHHYDNIPTKEECANRITTTTTNSFRSNYRESRQYSSGFTRTTSYQTEEQSTISIVSREQTKSVSFYGHNNKDDDNNLCSEKPKDRIQLNVSKPFYSEVGTAQSLSTDSKRQQACEPSPSSEEASDEKRWNQDRRKKRARNRWHLAYRIIHTPHLFDLRKDVQNRLVFVRSQTKILIDEEQLRAIMTHQQQPSTAETEMLRMRGLR
jgi:hypothetical protein